MVSAQDETTLRPRQHAREVGLCFNQRDPPLDCVYSTGDAAGNARARGADAISISHTYPI